MTEPTPEGHTPGGHTPGEQPTEAQQTPQAQPYAQQPPPAAPPPGYAPSPGYTPPPGYAPPPPGYGYPPQYVVARPQNGLAIASMILSIVGLGPIGAILGHVARNQIRERGEDGDGFALAGIIIGWIITGIWVLFCASYAVLFGLFATTSGVVNQ